MRGDHGATASGGLTLVGSSSHAWGPLAPHVWCHLETQFILTCVGTTRTWQDHDAVHTVHPHMRGDHALCTASACATRGSSSHAWGPPPSGESITVIHRFILTCVGTTGCFYRRSNNVAVHPHMRGDHSSVSKPNSIDLGSSSHAWGPRRHPARSVATARFILTCVGTTVGDILGTH